MAAQSQRSLSELLQAAKQMTTKADASLALDGLQASSSDARPTPMEGVRDDLPRVDRSLAQLVKVGESLWPGKSGRDAARLPADHEAHASILLGSRGLDLPHMTCRLSSLASTPSAADAAAAAAAGPSVLSLEASHPASLAAYVRQQRQSAIVAALHAASNQTSEEVERSQHQQRQCEWELTKQNLLAAFTQGGDDLLSLTLPVQDALPPAASSSVTTSASGGGLSNTELQYTAVLVAHNKQKLCHGVTPNMAAAMYDVAQTHNDQAVSDLWRVVAAMSEVSESMASSSGPCQHRTSPAVTAAVVQHATDLLQTKYREHMKALVYNDLSRAGLGGVPGLAGLVKAYVSVSLPGNLHALLEDGVASNGAPVWPLLYYCVRAGGVREAAAAASENSSPAVVEIVGCLQQCSRSEDSRVSPEGEKRLRVSYKRSCKGMRDPFKRALYCLLGRCDVMEDHSDIITTTDDYLWLKLSLVDPSSESDGAVPATPTLGGGAAATKQQDVLSLASLQKLLYKQYGETHFNAYEQPLLYTTVLLLTGQFEAAIEFLRRSDRYLHHAVHIAASLYACGALCLPRSIAAPLLSRESDEPECCLRLNIARLVLLYTRRFESTNPNEALHYCFLLRELKSPTEGDVFTSSAVELCLSSREFDLLLGKLGEDGARAPGLLDAFNVDVVEVTEMVAQSCEKRGLHEDAVKLYDLAKNHEKVITLLNKLLAQVVHLATPSSTSVSAAGAGSDRERVLELACTIGLRYRAQGHTASQQSASTLHLLLDLATVFDLYHAQRYHDTIEVIRRLHLIALDRSEVEARVSGLVGVASEVKEVIPALLLAAITATHHIYTTSSSSSSPSTPTTVGDASTTQHLRQQARAIVTFAGMIPLRLHADVNARLVQLEALIN